MQRFFIFLISALLFAGCKNSHAPKTLESAFLQSLQENNFALLEPYLPDIAFYRSLGNKMPTRSDKEINEFLDESNEKIEVAWKNTLYNTVEKKVDLKKVELKEVIYYDPFLHDDQSEAMVINYTYNNRTWDDLQFIVNRQKGKTYLLGIPNPTRGFSFIDTALRASYEARLNLETKKPEFKKSLEEQVKRIILSVKENNSSVFAENLIYRGNDENRRWKSALNPNDSLEMAQANVFMERVSRYLEGCENFETAEINLERESEGIWILFPIKCGNRIMQFAFLKVGDKVLLGDIDARGN
jgi:hypothetical protein